LFADHPQMADTQADLIFSQSFARAERRQDHLFQ
jgi:hypothetical protein